MLKLRKAVFYPPFVLLLLCALLSLFFPDQFLERVRSLNDWILVHFGNLFSYATFFFVLLVIGTLFSPLSRIKIGGERAKPMLSRWQWFSITLCTTIATGILFWGTAEPIFHLHQGPEAIRDKPTFAMSTMFMHWTITPYAMYTTAAIVSALCFYNLRLPFSIISMTYPIVGQRVNSRFMQAIDAICLFALVAGMAASLGAGILSISGGLNRVFDIPGNSWTYLVIAGSIAGCFVFSASTGLLKGIRWLSLWNVRFFFILAIFFFIAGPTQAMLEIGWQGLKDYLINFFPRSVALDSSIDPAWSRSWTVFYWANWLAWTPVTAIFLGRLSVGYRVREVVIVNLLLPALFGALWMTIFAGYSIQLDGQETGLLGNLLESDGAQSIIYALMDRLPLAQVLAPLFVLIVFISYVTAADSNTSAMTGMSYSGINPENQEAPVSMKIIWGLLIATISWIMISFAGIDGIKMTSNLGGFPALFIILIVALGLLRFMLNPKLVERD